MKLFLSFVNSSLLFAASTSLVFGIDCQEGFDAFSASVFPAVRNDCAGCHDGSVDDAPGFARNDPEHSYKTLIKYMNFSKLENSKLVFRAGNDHCGGAECNDAAGKEMLSLVQDWWAQGENICARTGRVFSEEIVLPSSLPSREEGFVSLSVPLKEVGTEFQDASLVFEIQEYAETSGFTLGSFRVVNPRVVGLNHSVKVKGLKFLIDGQYDSVSNTYDNLNRVVNSYPVEGGDWSTLSMSSDYLMLLKTAEANQNISVSFLDFTKTSNETECSNSSMFMSAVMPSVNSLNCSECHNGSGDMLSQRVFNTDLDAEHSCKQFSELVQYKYFMTSPLVRYPVHGVRQHPRIEDAQVASWLDALRRWTEK